QMIHQAYPNAAATQQGRNFFTLPRAQWLAVPDLPVQLPMAAIKLAQSDQRPKHPDRGTADPQERRNQSRAQWLRRVIDPADPSRTNGVDRPDPVLRQRRQDRQTD